MRFAIIVEFVILFTLGTTDTDNKLSLWSAVICSLFVLKKAELVAESLLFKARIEFSLALTQIIQPLALIIKAASNARFLV